jgi:hypothetical protein
MTTSIVAVAAFVLTVLNPEDGYQNTFTPLQACPIVNKPRNEPAWIPPTSFAASAAAISTQYQKGAILVIGANEGKLDNDPAFQILSSKQASHLHKIFVEPVPYLFHQLEKNIQNIPRARAVQVAISNRSGTLDMYCFAMDPNRGPPVQWPESLRAKARFNSAKRDGRGWWSQICSLSRERLFNVNDMGRDFANVHDLEPFVTSTKVDVVTLDDLLHDVHQPVRHVQIDVEGLDDVVLRMLPLGLMRNGHTFRPASITFEQSVLDTSKVLSACHWLQRRGYSVCREGQNVVAFALPA